MKAAVLKAFGSPLVVETVPDPVLGTGEVIVDVSAARVLGYAHEIFSGQRRYLMALPMIPGPGGVGRVRATGPDATHLAVGDWVNCDPTVRSRDDLLSPDIILQGLTAGSASAQRLQTYFHDGSFAEQVRVPTENVTPIGAIEPEDAPSWCALGTLLVPYGGFLAANLKAGETVLVNGATGTFGSAAVAVAVAMGAACVIATGRNEAPLNDLARRLGPRVRTVKMVGNEEADRRRILAAAPSPIDCVLDLLPPMATALQVRAALMTVRPYGRIVLMGGVGMAGGDGLVLDYAWVMRNCITIIGKWMYPPEATPRMIALIRAGLVKLDDFEVSTFSLDEVNDAVAYAAAHSGPFRMTVVQP
ncbi:alcohol dehydrogenase catalytic domain-containing protein [Reyranella aquatilis]|uniref:Alcohol dehydrogenase catalytic domain-containing protein n=1 Tax=Reyranella aquatilis TaxID=2035356 RepID=A0ABS8KYM1_9HYPH|nr:zinc-binding dehydrogenase [Reyranella aquatilis]MCC8431200.1 alcohol dehydrogenase catalytic domain-containing protein [Reyranella aquatilis]